MADLTEHGTVVVGVSQQLILRKKELELSTHRVQLQRFEIAELEAKLRDQTQVESVSATNLRIDTLTEEIKQLRDADAPQTEEG